MRQVAITLEMIKFQHTLFALPFALLSAFVYARGVPPWTTLLWIVLAMIGARSAAMAFNRLLDARIDARNPRTATRAIPAGLVSSKFVALFTLSSIALFLGACAALNPLALFLSPVALLIILGYSAMKRFTALSHLVLGLALAIAPAGAAVAVTATLPSSVLPLCAAILVWTAGFDILYSMQDLEFDRSAGLHSIPSRFGVRRAFVIARMLHLLAVVFFAAFGWVNGLGVFYFAGVAAAAGLLLWQHSIISPGDIRRIDAAFFTANGILAVVMFVAGACDILAAGMKVGS